MKKSTNKTMDLRAHEHASTNHLIDTLVNEADGITRISPNPGRSSITWTIISSISVATFSTLIFGWRGAFPSRISGASFLISLGLLVTITGVAAYQSFASARPAWKPLAGMRQILFIASVMLLVDFSAGYFDQLTSEVDHYGLKCSESIVILAMPFIAALLFSLKSLASIRPLWTGIYAAIAGWAVGCLGISLHCPIQDPLHLYLYHTGPILVISGLTLVAANKWLRW